MGRAEVAARADHARAFLAAADLVVDFGEDAEITPASNIIGSLSVLAGIAASDALCGHAVGMRSASANHADALGLLARSSPSGSAYSARLRTLLDSKSNAHYSAMRLSDGSAAELLKTARRLVDAMESELRR